LLLGVQSLYAFGQLRPPPSVASFFFERGQRERERRRDFQ
jgi:hypothetical protein